MGKTYIVPEARKINEEGFEEVYPQFCDADAVDIAISWQGYHLPDKGVFVIESLETKGEKETEFEKKREVTLLDGRKKSKEKVEEILGRKLGLAEDPIEEIHKLKK